MKPMSCSAIPLAASSRSAAWAAPSLSKSPMTVLAMAPSLVWQKKEPSKAGAKRPPSGRTMPGGGDAPLGSPECRASKYENMPDSPLDVAVELVRDPASLARVGEQWQELARHALEPIPLNDPAMTLGLLAAAGGSGFCCCLSWARDPERSDLPAALGGLFALRRERSACGFASWIVDTALVGPGGAHRHVSALLDCLKRSGAAVVEFRQVAGDGRLNDALADVLRERASTVHVREGTGPGGGPGVRDLMIGLCTVGGLWVSMQPLLDRARRLKAASRAESRPMAA